MRVISTVKLEVVLRSAAVLCGAGRLVFPGWYLDVGEVGIIINCWESIKRVLCEISDQMPFPTTSGSLDEDGIGLLHKVI